MSFVLANNDGGLCVVTWRTVSISSDARMIDALLVVTTNQDVR